MFPLIGFYSKHKKRHFWNVTDAEPHIYRTFIFPLMTITLTASVVDSAKTPPKGQLEIYDESFLHGGSFGLRVNQRGTKSFFLIYSLLGKRKRMTLGRYPEIELEEARERAVELVAKVSRGEDPAAAQKMLKKQPSFRDLAEAAWADLRNAGRSEKTIAEYERIAESELFPRFADRPLTAIRTEEFEDVLSEIAEKRDSPAYSNRVRSALRAVYATAGSVGLLDASQEGVVEIPRYDERRRPPRSYDLSELQEIYRASENLRLPARFLFQFILLSAQRVTDCVQISWGDLELDYWKRSVNAQSTQNPKAATPKHFGIYLPDVLVELIRESGVYQRKTKTSPGRHESDSEVGSQYVIATVNGKRFDSLRHYLKPLEKLFPEFNLRSLQASLEPAMLDAGIRPDVAGYLRSDFAILKRIAAPEQAENYAKAAGEALEQWQRRLSGKGPRPTPGEPRTSPAPQDPGMKAVRSNVISFEKAKRERGK